MVTTLADTKRDLAEKTTKREEEAKCRIVCPPPSAGEGESPAPTISVLSTEQKTVAAVHKSVCVAPDLYPWHLAPAKEAVRTAGVASFPGGFLRVTLPSAQGGGGVGQTALRGAQTPGRPLPKKFSPCGKRRASEKCALATRSLPTCTQDLFPVFCLAEKFFFSWRVRVPFAKPALVYKERTVDKKPQSIRSVRLFVPHRGLPLSYYCLPASLPLYLFFCGVRDCFPV